MSGDFPHAKKIGLEQIFLAGARYHSINARNVPCVLLFYLFKFITNDTFVEVLEKSKCINFKHFIVKLKFIANVIRFTIEKTNK